MPSTNRWPHLVDAEGISEWASRTTISSSAFPGMIRMLLARNNDQITRLDMPDAEGVGAPGYDGIIEALRGTTLVPPGRSVWEMGVGGDFKAKATRDYNKRVKNPLGENQGETTFVFVTPHQWQDKEAWERKRRAQGPWKDVRVLDVYNLLQGLVEARAIHVRWTEIALNRPASGVRSIEDWWRGFSGTGSPAVSAEIALAGRADQAARLLTLLDETRTLTTIRAKSVDDVLAFVACAMLTAPEDSRNNLLGRTLIVHDAAALRQLDGSERLLILVPFEEQMRREAELVRSNHVLFICEEDMPADVELPDIDIAEVTRLLIAQGVERELAADLGKAAGDSLKKFQRVASQQKAPQPTWDAAFAVRGVRRAWLLRSWTTARSGDLDAFERLVGKAFDVIEEPLRQAARGADPVFTRVGPVWSVVSPADFWEHVRPHLTAPDLAALERTVQDVLGAVDPTLDLPSQERWLAGMRGVTPVHSHELRRGLATTVALVGALAETTVLDSGRTGGAWADGVVRNLLTRANADGTGQLWASLTDVLPLVAEASPDAFLGALDQAITSSNGALSRMFSDNQTDLLTVASPHTSLLWALEVTAWLPSHFGQSVSLLAALAELDPGGRLSNRPSGSLKDIFRPWWPQTLVSRQGRLASLAALTDRYPDVASRLLVDLLPTDHDSAMPNAKPRFREGITEAQHVSPREWAETTTAIVSMLLPMMRAQGALWPDFLAHLHDLQAAERDRVYAELPFALKELTTADRTLLWEKATEEIRRHREYQDAPWALPEEELGRFQAAILGAKPNDSRDEARWLFEKTHPDIGIRRTDHEQYDRGIAAMRAAAVKHVLDARGIIGVESLAQAVEWPYLVGSALAAADEWTDHLAVLGHLDCNDQKLVAFAASYAIQMDNQDPQFPFRHLGHFAGRPLAQARLLQVALDLPKAWAMAEELGSQVDQAYWDEFSVTGRGGDFELVDEASRELLDHRRPAAALALALLYMRGSRKRPNPRYVVEGLKALEGGDEDLSRMSSYEIEELLSYLRQTDTDDDELAMLEWKFLSALGHEPHGLSLQRKLARDPGFFIEILSLCYKPKHTDNATDVPPLIAANAYRLLRNWHTVPGSDGPAQPVSASALDAWYTAARPLLIEADRLDVGEQVLGQTLAHGPSDPDGLWPDTVVRSFIERAARTHIETGFSIECFNKRGVVSRSLYEGGKQELALVQQYTDWADRMAITAPRTAAALRSLAADYRLDAIREDQESQRRLKGFDR